MKIIDLLNKIANGEEVPEKIKYGDEKFVFNNKTHQYYVGDNSNDIKTYYDDSLKERLYNFIKLNDEVEIIEEDKKIEKIDIKRDKDYYVLDEDNVKRYLNERDKIEMNKINEIIDYLMEDK